MTKAAYPNLTIELDDDADALQDISQYVTSINGWTKERLVEELTGAGESDDRWGAIGFLQKNEVELTGPYDDTANGLVALVNAWTDDSERTLKFTWLTGTSESVEVLLRSVAINPSRGAFHSYVVTLRPTGAIS